MPEPIPSDVIGGAGQRNGPCSFHSVPSATGRSDADADADADAEVEAEAETEAGTRVPALVLTGKEALVVTGKEVRKATASGHRRLTPA